MATITPDQLEALRNRKDLLHDSRRALILAVEIPLALVMVVVITARFYARVFVKRALGKDDWMMAAAFIFGLAGTILNCVGTRFGTGTHIWDLDLKNVPMGGKLGYAYTVLFTPAVVFCKMSICITYLRIFPSKLDRRICIGTMWFLALSGIGCTIALMLPCIPIQKYWAMGDPNRKCYDIRLAFVITSSMNTVTDLAVFLWPAPRLWTVRNIPVRQRIGLILVFSIGCVICAAGVARIWYVATHYYESVDVFYNMSILYVLSALECNLAIVCGSLPQIRPLFSKHRDTSNHSRPQSGPSDIDGRPHDDENRGSNQSVLVITESHTQSKGGLDSRQMSINIMLDEEVWRQNFGGSRPHSMNTNMNRSTRTSHEVHAGRS